MALGGSRGKYPYHEGKHLIASVVLHSYADESGIHGSPFCILAGFIGSPAQWTAFRKEWAALTVTAPFHSKDFFPKEARQGLSNPYRNWTGQQSADYLNALVALLLKYKRIKPVAVVVDVEAFLAKSLEDRRFLSGGLLRLNTRTRKQSWYNQGSPNRPYFVAFHTFLDQAAEKTNRGLKIHFYFDSQATYESHAHQTFQQLIALHEKDGHKHSLFDLTYTSSQDEPALQAADLYAYLLQSWYNQPDKEKIQPSRGLALNELLKKDNKVAFVGQEVIDHLLELWQNDLEARLERR